MIRDILSVRRGECRFCITDDTPFLFCGDPVQPESAYCPEHHAVCHNGFGKDVGLLERIMVSAEQSVVRSGKPQRTAEGFTRAPGADPSSTTPVDVQIRGRE